MIDPVPTSRPIARTWRARSVRRLTVCLAAACLTVPAAPSAAQTAADYLGGSSSSAATKLHISAAHGANSQGTPDATIFRTDATWAGFTAGRGAARTRSRDLAAINAPFTAQIIAGFHHETAGTAFLFLDDGWAVGWTNGQFSPPHKIDDRSWPGLQPYARSITAALNGESVVWLFLNDGTYLQYDLNARTTSGPFPVDRDWNGVGPSAQKIRGALRWDASTVIFFLEDDTFLTYDLVGRRVFGGGARPTDGKEWPGLFAASAGGQTNTAPPVNTRPAPVPTTRPTTQPAPRPTTRPVTPQTNPPANPPVKPPVNTRPARPATGLWVDTSKPVFSTTDTKILVNYGRVNGTGLIEIFKQGAITAAQTRRVTAANGSVDFNGPLEAGPYYVKMTVGATESPAWDFTVVTPPLRTRLRLYYPDNPVDVIYDRHDGKGYIQIWSVNPPGRLTTVDAIETDPAGGVVKFPGLNQRPGKYEARLFTETTPGSGRYSLADQSWGVYPFELVARPAPPKPPTPADPFAKATASLSELYQIVQPDGIVLTARGRVDGANGATMTFRQRIWQAMPDGTWRLAYERSENQTITSTALAGKWTVPAGALGMAPTNQWHQMRVEVSVSINNRQLTIGNHDFKWFR